MQNTDEMNAKELEHAIALARSQGRAARVHRLEKVLRQRQADAEYVSCPSHCCARHGCKYGYVGCPVAAGRVLQEHPCPYCPPKETITKVVELLFPISLMDRAPLSDWVEEHFDELRRATDFDVW